MAVPEPDPQALRRAAHALLASHWREPGYTCPNAERYPWLWLWDSCFHSIVWAELGEPDRAISELRSVFAHRDPETGFVPHMTYFGAPDTGADFWGRRWTSSITQPPMFGHAVAELVRRGIDVPPDLVACATAGLRFLLDLRRRSPGGLIELVHPWESGADDSPRWDHFVGGDWSLERWRQRKGELLARIKRTESGAPVANPDFAVGSASFTALVAFNARELATVTGDERLTCDADELAGALDQRWDGDQVTWVDDGPSAATSGRARTAEALLGVLVSRRDGAVSAAFEQLLDPAGFGGRFGPAGVHRDEPSFDASSYWRGPAWPQISYLLWHATAARGLRGPASTIGQALRAGASQSGWAEYWDPDTAVGGGAIPQSWTTLAVLTS